VHRKLRATRWWHVLASLGALTVTLMALVAVLVAAASGSVGPGRLAHVGAHGLLVGVLAGAGVLVGAVVVAVPGDPLVRAELRRVLRRAPRSVGPEPADED
jgi:hypothetical protein